MKQKCPEVSMKHIVTIEGSETQVKEALGRMWDVWARKETDVEVSLAQKCPEMSVSLGALLCVIEELNELIDAQSDTVKELRNEIQNLPNDTQMKSEELEVVSDALESLYAVRVTLRAMANTQSLVAQGVMSHSKCVVNVTND